VIDGRIHWSFKDPSSLKGTEEEVLEETRKVRDEIKHQIIGFLDDI